MKRNLLVKSILIAQHISLNGRHRIRQANLKILLTIHQANFMIYHGAQQQIKKIRPKNTLKAWPTPVQNWQLFD